MHITQPRADLLSLDQQISDLERLLEPAADMNFHPCPGCSKVLHSGGCSPLCNDAAKALSSEPDRYPLEPFVVAIVYELNNLYLLQSCWSCQGHLDQQGRLWKLPQISFYAASPLYPQLLSNYLGQLLFEKKLSHTWRVAFTNFGQSLAATYCIEPSLEVGQSPDLDQIHRDLLHIGQRLADNLRQEARRMLQQLRGGTHV